MLNKLFRKLDVLSILIFSFFIFIYLVSINNINLFQLSILIILIFVLSLIEIYISRTFVSPLFFFYIFWLLPISIAKYDAQIYDFGLSGWSSELNTIIVINTIVFYGIFKITKGLKIYSKNKNSSKIYNFERLAIVVNLLLLFGIFSFILNVFKFGYIPQLSTNVNVTRLDFVTSSYFFIVNSMRFAYTFVPFVLKYSKNYLNRNCTILLSIVFFAFHLLTGWRGYLFQIIIFYLTSLLILNKGENMKNLKRQIEISVFFVLISLMIIFIVGSLRASALNQKIENPVQFTFETIYLYIAPNYRNFGKAILNLKPINSFIYTSELFWGFIKGFDPTTNFPNIFYSIGGFNVSTYLLQPYLDFGVIGTVFWTSIISISAALSFRYSFLNSENRVIFVFYVGFINNVIFTMHNGFFLRSQSIVIWFILSIIITKSGFFWQNNKISYL